MHVMLCMHNLLFFFVIILCSINILMLCSRRTVQAENTHIHTLWQNYGTAHTRMHYLVDTQPQIHSYFSTHTQVSALPIMFAHTNILPLTSHLGIYAQSISIPLLCGITTQIYNIVVMLRHILLLLFSIRFFYFHVFFKCY